MNKPHIYHLLIAITDLDIKPKTFISSSFRCVMGCISKKVNFDIKMFGYKFLSTWVWWKSTLLYMCANWFIRMSEIKFFSLIFLFSNLISLLSKYDGYYLFCLFLLTILLGFCCLIQAFIYDFFFYISKFFSLLILNSQP